MLIFKNKKYNNCLFIVFIILTFMGKTMLQEVGEETHHAPHAQHPIEHTPQYEESEEEEKLTSKDPMFYVCLVIAICNFFN